MSKRSEIKYSPKILQAVNFATQVHRGKPRKGKPDIPYLTHPLTVGIYLAKAGANEDIIVAGILHDTIEDCEPYGSVTKEFIAKMFGKEVAEMVNDVTEQDKSLSWPERKQRALEHIPDMSHASLMVKAADQLHNMTDQIEDFKKDGDKMFKNFNASKEDQLDRYDKLIPAIEKAWPANPLLPDLISAFNKIKSLWV